MAMGWIVEPAGLAGIGFVFGLTVGSFLNVVIHRLPAGESIVSPRSRCPHCRVPIAAWDNVPIFSYLLLRGRCRHCGARISVRYPLVELATGCLFAAVLWRFGATWLALALLIFVAGLLVAALVDFDHQIIPDPISLGGIAFGIAVVPAARALAGESWMDAFTTSLLGGVVGGALLWSVAFFHARLSVALGRRYEHWPGEGEELPGPASADYYLWFPGMGLGDIKLLAMVGVFLGPWGVLVTILSASLLGLLLGAGFAIATRSFSAPFGFGPAIALGAIGALLVPLPRFLMLG
jgi:leader peptidase (prepilin peptidase)/N-methyltransferase